MKAFLLILSIGWCLHGSAQQEHFVFLQTENHQPFYARLGEKNYSSSSSGYLILSKMKDSSYSFVIGFPQNQFPEQTFAVVVDKNDRGFEIKNLGSQGWALFDLQTMQLIHAAKPAGTASGGASYNLIKKDDGFARLMAGVVNDTAVMYTVVVLKDTVKADVAKKEKKPEVVPDAKNEDSLKADVAKNEKKPEIVPEKKNEDSVKADVAKEEKKPVIVSDSLKPKEVVVKTDELKNTDTAAITSKLPEEVKPDEVKKADSAVIAPKLSDPEPAKDSVFNPPALPVIHVVNEFKSDSGYHLIYVDEMKDSIDVFIPHEVKVDPGVTAPPKTDTAVAIKDTAVQVVTPPAQEAVVDSSKAGSKLVMINSDCRNFATTNDVDKLRVKLINEKDSEDRIAASKKAFRSKCYTAQQIKALSELFPADEQKYKFFEAAYPFVSDTGNFKSLVSLFTDPVYTQRFRKLVRLD